MHNVKLITMFVRTPYLRIDGEDHPIEFTGSTVKYHGQTCGVAAYDTDIDVTTVAAVKPDGTILGHYRTRYHAAAALIREHLNTKD